MCLCVFLELNVIRQILNPWSPWLKHNIHYSDLDIRYKTCYCIWKLFEVININYIFIFFPDSQCTQLAHATEHHAHRHHSSTTQGGVAMAEAANQWLAKDFQAHGLSLLQSSLNPEAYRTIKIARWILSTPCKKLVLIRGQRSWTSSLLVQKSPTQRPHPSVSCLAGLVTNAISFCLLLVKNIDMFRRQTNNFLIIWWILFPVVPSSNFNLSRTLERLFLGTTVRPSRALNLVSYVASGTTEVQGH